MTVPAIRAAVVAIRAGVFDGPDDVGISFDDRIRPLAAGGERLRSIGVGLPWRDVDIGGPAVLVLAGHAGAGASTVAMALAEGLAEGARAQLLEYAEPARSGLVAASSIELGEDDAGWRHGRRDWLDVFRLVHSPAEAALPQPPDWEDAKRVLVVDVGWSLTSVLIERGLDGASLDGERVVVVTRVTAPGLRQTEHALAAVGGEPVVAAVGPARWPRAVEAGCGPLLGRLRSRGRVVRVPIVRRLEIAGLTGDRLPRSVAAAGRALARLLERPDPQKPGGGATPPRTGRAGTAR